MGNTLKPLKPEQLQAEMKHAWHMLWVVLIALWVAKSVGGGWLGTTFATIAMGLQLYLPIRWLHRTMQPDSVIGWRRDRIGKDLKLVGILCLVTFPLYGVAHVWMMEHGRTLVIEMGGLEFARWIPQKSWSLDAMLTQLGQTDRLLWLGERIATHLFGVALPEETFYRGFLLTIFQSVWIPSTTLLGVRFGKAVIVTNLFFALGHIVGEWNPLRFGPFFPGLVFAWLFNATGSIWGAVVYHAASNVFGEILALGYGPAMSG
jgi:membrane protease YdiL (CAAX protease family)